MSNALYPFFKEQLGKKQIDLINDVIKARCVTNAYVYSSAHQYLSDALVGSPDASIGQAGALSSKDFTNALFSAADTPIVNSQSGSANAILLFHDTGNPATSVLVAYLDTGTNLPFDPLGSDFTIYWSTYGIFQL